MAVVESFRAGDFFEALVLVQGVLAEHAEALNLLADAMELEPMDPDVMEPIVFASPGPESDSRERGVGSDLSSVFEAALDAARGCRDLATMTVRLREGASAAATSITGEGLTLVLAGFAEVLANSDVVDGERLSLSLEVAAENLASSRVSGDPGRLAAVVAASSMGALRAFDQQRPLAEVLIAAGEEGLEELENGPRSNPSLAVEGVVDASGAGFLLILDVLAAIATGEPLPAAPSSGPGGSGDREVISGERPHAVYLVSSLLEPLEGSGIESAAWLESIWFELGEISLFDGFGSTWSLEIETADPGRAIEAMCRVGSPRQLRIRVLGPSDHLDEERSDQENSDPGEASDLPESVSAPV